MANIDISKKITLLNQTTLDSMVEKQDTAIIKNFIMNGRIILGADFGWAWWKEKDGFRLAYKCPRVPFNPPVPREKGGNFQAVQNKAPFFDSEVKDENYKSLTIPHIHRYFKSYIIIPIYYGNHLYGNFMFCYKRKHVFEENELSLAQAIGNTAAQAITIHRFIETDILLTQEKLKTEFIANITHELRTPLTIMRGYVYLAKQKKQARRTTQDALQVIDKEIVHLSDMLSDLVLITRGSSVEINHMPIAVFEILQNVTKRLKNLASDKKIKIILKNANKKSSVLGDNNYLERMFLNITKNAITYGGSKINIGIEDKKKWIAVKISDDGIGISREDLPHIFERFYRADKSRSRGKGRTGLGLSIAKWIAENHGGRIEVKSAPEVGSTFTIFLPKEAK